MKESWGSCNIGRRLTRTATIFASEKLYSGVFSSRAIEKSMLL
jgi:hypothetical protein